MNTRRKMSFLLDGFAEIGRLHWSQFIQAFSCVTAGRSYPPLTVVQHFEEVLLAKDGHPEPLSFVEL
jgi:hypothetical protein